MGTCKLCGRKVTAGSVHQRCLRHILDRAEEAFCEQSCKWPERCDSREELDEHCAGCVLNELHQLVET